MVARKNPRWFSNLREMRGAMDVAFSGIINASVCAKVFKLSRTTVTTVWRAIACAALLAQTALLVLMSRCAESMPAGIPYTVWVMKFDETKHTLSHKGTSRWSRFLGKRRRPPQQAWHVLVTTMFFRMRPPSGRERELPITIPPMVMYGTSAAHLWTAFTCKFMTGLFEAIQRLWRVSAVNIWIMEQDSASSNKMLLAHWLVEQTRLGLVVFWG